MRITRVEELHNRNPGIAKHKIGQCGTVWRHHNRSAGKKLHLDGVRHASQLTNTETGTLQLFNKVRLVENLSF